MFRVKELTKRFGGVRALYECTFSVPANTVTGVVGPNGAGKTTLFDVINGFITADSGSVYFQDRDITGLPPHAVARLGIARTFQLVRVYKDLSLVDNLLLGRWSRAIPLLAQVLFRPSRSFASENTVLARCKDLVAVVGLADKFPALAGELSYGQQKILEIIRAVASDASLYLFDEPAAGLDPRIKEVVGNIILDLRNRKKTIMVIEHDLAFVRDFCDQVIVLDQGAPIFFGGFAQLTAEPLVQDRYLSKGAYL